MASNYQNTEDINTLSEEELKKLSDVIFDKVIVVFSDDGSIDFKECWECKTTKTISGFETAVIRWDNKVAIAYRVSYRIFIGKLPVESNGDSFHCHHTCEEKTCANPMHIRPLTSRDHHLLHKPEVAKVNPKKKLEPNDVFRIRFRYGLGLYTRQEIGDEFDICKTYVSRLWSGKAWENGPFPWRNYGVDPIRDTPGE